MYALYMYCIFTVHSQVAALILPAETQRSSHGSHVICSIQALYRGGPVHSVLDQQMAHTRALCSVQSL